MSYCVNCGVKLADSEPVCPLCQTPVINPNQPTEAHRAYPDHIDCFPPQRVNRRFVIRLAWIVAGIISATCLFCDFFTTGSIGWSVYAVLGVLFIGSVASAFCFASVFVAVILFTASALSLLAVIAWLNSGWKWFVYLAVPFTLILGVLFFVCVLTIKKKIRSLLRGIAVCLLVCVFALIAIETMTDLYTGGQICLYWSIYPSVPISVIAIGLFILSFNKKLLAEIKKRTFL